MALDENTSNPMELTIADDGRVFYIDRNGAVRIIKENGSVLTAGTVPVYTGQEFGLLGIALDPDFATNNWVYLYYSPTGSESIDRISRFTMSGDTLQLNTATTILDVPTQRNECCHAGGSMEFDNDGNLYLATGDNTNPFDSGGYAPIDERPDRSAWDAQRTSANTNSLNGKVLRITPKADGGYTVPAGNLFDEAADTQQKTRPEIYAMGFRNPFRIGLDEQNNNLLVADYGPDAGSVSATRGPERPRGVERAGRAGQLRLALLRGQQHALQRLQLRQQHRGCDVQLQRAGQRLAQQHGPDQPAAGEGCGHLAEQQRLAHRHS